MGKINIKLANETIKIKQITNGPKIYFYEKDHQKRFTVTLFLPFGSDDENHLHNGVNLLPGTAHFLEHLMFNKTEEESYMDIYSELNLYSNASTSRNFTQYYISGTKNLNEGINHLLEMVFKAKFTKEEVEKEKGIILSEYNRIMVNPNSRLYITGNENLFKNKALKNHVIGTKESISSIDLEDINNAYNNYYSINNISALVTGNYNEEEVLNEFTKFFRENKYESKKIERRNIKEPNNVSKKFSLTENSSINYDSYLLQFKINLDNFKNININKNLISYIIRIILRTNFNNEYTDKLKKERIIIDYYVGNVERRGELLEVYLLYKGEDYKLISKTIKDKLNNLTLEKEEFEARLHYLVSSMYGSFDNLESVRRFIFNEMVTIGHIYENKLEELSRVTYETALEVLSLIKDYEITENILTPKKGKKTS